MGEVAARAGSAWGYGRRYFSAPTFSDDADLTRTAQILSSLLNYLTVVLVLATSVGLPFIYSNRAGSALVLVALWIIICTARSLMLRRRVRLASALIVAALWTCFTVLTVLTGGLYSINNVYFVSLTVVAGLLLGGRYAIGVAVMSSLVGLWMALLDHFGYQPIQPFPAPAFSRWIQLTLALLLTFAPLNLALQSLSRVLRSMRWQLEQRRRSQQALGREMAFSEALIDGLPGIFTVFNAEGRLLRYNALHQEITGYDADQLAKLRAGDLFGVDAWTRLEEQLSRTTVGGGIELEVELRCADGRTLSFYLSGWRRELDEAHYLILVGIDISERKRVEQERQQLEQMLLQAQKMESIGQLAGGIAHDFNNLLTGIRGYAELALLDAPNGERPQEDLQEILRATMSAAQLTQQLLAFSRKEIAAPRIIDVHAELESLSRMLTRLIGDTVDFRTEPMAERVTVLMDPLQLEQLLINLAINARDAMPKGGRLTTRTSNIELGEPRRIGPVDLPAGHYLLVEVQDTGTGISAESLEHIFEPFFTTKGEEEGTGLGLSTVYGIVIQNGGSLDVTSTVGVGSTFRIYLPWADGPVAELVALPSPSTESTPMADLEQTILLVEDDDRVRGITERILLELGYRVITCAGSAQALREAELLDGELDALLTDVMMPEMNGKELAEAITALYPHVCVIFASGYAKSVLGEDWVVERGFHFIQKPYSIKGLARLIKELL